MKINPETLTQARNEGYSDDDIWSYLSQEDDRFIVAKASGYSLDEVASYFAPPKPEPEPEPVVPEPIQQPQEEQGPVDFFLSELQKLGPALQSSLDQPTEAMAATATVLGAPQVGQVISGLVPETEAYEPAAGRFTQPEEGDFSILGFAPQYAPRAIVEQTGQLIGSILSRAAGSAVGSIVPGVGKAVGSFAGPFIFEASQIVGPVAIERARNNGREIPTNEDIAYGFVTATASGALNAIGAKYLPGGEKAIGSFGRRIAQSFLGEALTEAPQALVQQAGESLGTEAGLQLNIKEAIGEGLIGGAAGATGTPISYGLDVINANKEISTNQEAADQVKSLREGLQTQINSIAGVPQPGDTIDPERAPDIINVTAPTQEAIALGAAPIDSDVVAKKETELAALAEQLSSTELNNLSRNDLLKNYYAAEVDYINNILIPSQKNVLIERTIRDSVARADLGDAEKNQINALAKIATGQQFTQLTPDELNSVGVTQTPDGRYVADGFNALIGTDNEGNAFVTDRGIEAAQAIGIDPLNTLVAGSRKPRPSGAISQQEAEIIKEANRLKQIATESATIAPETARAAQELASQYEPTTEQLEADAKRTAEEAAALFTTPTVPSPETGQVEPEATSPMEPEQRGIREAIRDKDLVRYDNREGFLSTDEEGNLFFRDAETREEISLATQAVDNRAVTELEGLEYIRKGQTRKPPQQVAEVEQIFNEAATVVEGEGTTVAVSPLEQNQQAILDSEDDIAIPEILLTLESDPVVNLAAEVFELGESADVKEGRRRAKPLNQQDEYYRQLSGTQISSARRSVNTALRVIDRMDIPEDQKDVLAEPWLQLDNDIDNYEKERNARQQSRQPVQGVQQTPTQPIGTGQTQTTAPTTIEGRIENAIQIGETEALPVGERTQGGQEVGQRGEIPQAEAQTRQAQVGVPNYINQAISEATGPISAADVAQYNVQIPQGWRLEDDLYFPPAREEAATVIQAPQVAAGQPGATITTYERIQSENRSRLASETAAVQTPNFGTTPSQKRASLEGFTKSWIERYADALGTIGVPISFNPRSGISVEGEGNISFASMSADGSISISIGSGVIENSIKNNRTETDSRQRSALDVEEEIIHALYFKRILESWDGTGNAVTFSRKVFAERMGGIRSKLGEPVFRQLVSDTLESYYKGTLQGEQLDSSILDVLNNEPIASLIFMQELSRMAVQNKVRGITSEDSYYAILEAVNIYIKELLSALRQFTANPSLLGDKVAADIDAIANEYQAMLDAVAAQQAAIQPAQQSITDKEAAQAKVVEQINPVVDLEEQRRRDIRNVRATVARNKSRDKSINVVGNWASTITDKPTKRLVDIILANNPSLADIPIRYSSVLMDQNFDGLYSIEDRKITIAAYTSQDTNLVIAHELVHAATIGKTTLWDNGQIDQLSAEDQAVFKELDKIRQRYLKDALKKNPELKRVMGIENQLDRAVDAAANPDISSYEYSLISMTEFLANAVNARAFMNRLAKEDVSTFTKIWNHIKSLVFGKNKKLPTALDAVWNSIIELSKTEQQPAQAVVAPSKAPTQEEAEARTDARKYNQEAFGTSVLIDDISEPLYNRVQQEIVAMPVAQLNDILSSETIGQTEANKELLVASYLYANGGLMPKQAPPTGIVRPEKATPEYEAVRLMGRAMQLADQASNQLESNKQTYPVADIYATWLQSGLGTTALSNAIVQYTNLTEAQAKQFATKLARANQLQGEIFATKQRAKDRVELNQPAQTNREKANRKRMVELQAAAGTIDQIAEAITLAYDVQSKSPSSNKATLNKQINEQLKVAKRILQTVVPKQYLGDTLTALSKATGLAGLKDVIDAAQKGLQQAQLAEATTAARNAYDKAKAAVRKGELGKDAQAVLREFVDKYKKSGMSEEVRASLTQAIQQYDQNPVAALQDESLKKYLKRAGELEAIQINADLGLDALNEITNFIQATLTADRRAKGEMAYNKSQTRQEVKQGVMNEWGKVKSILKQMKSGGREVGAITKYGVIRGMRVEDILLGVGAESTRKLIYEDLALNAYNDEMRNRQTWEKQLETKLQNITGYLIGSKDYEIYANTEITLTGTSRTGEKGDIKVRRSELWDLAASLMDPSNLRKASKNGYNIRRLENAKFDKVAINPSTYQEIMDSLSEKDRAVVDMLRGFYDTLGDSLDQAYVKAYGHGIKRSPGYYPRQSDSLSVAQFKPVDLEFNNVIQRRVDDVGHLKDRQERETGEEMVASDAIQRLVSHIRDDARISAYLPITQDIYSVLRDAEVAREIIGKVGRDAYDQLVGSVVQQTTPIPASQSRGLNTLMRNIGVGALGFKLHAVLQNVTGWPISMAYYGQDAFKYLSKTVMAGNKVLSKKNRAEMDGVLGKYSPYYEERYGSSGFMNEMTGGLVGYSDFRYVRKQQQLSMAWLENADKIGAMVRFQVAKQVVADKTNFQPGTEDYNRAVAKEWQLMMFRSENTSHGSDRTGYFQWLAKNPSFSIFMAFQTAVSKQYSLLGQSMLRGMQGDTRGAARTAAFTMLSVYMSYAISQVFYGFLTGGGEDEEEKKSIKAQIGELLTAPISIMPIFGNFLQQVAEKPFQDQKDLMRKPMQIDVLSSLMFSAYDISTGAGKAINEAIEQKINEQTGGAKWVETLQNTTLKAMAPLGMIIGKPLGGIVQLGKLGQQVYNKFLADEPKEEQYLKAIEELEKEEKKEPVTQEYAKLYFAAVEGNKTQFKRAYEEMLAKRPDASFNDLYRAAMRRPEFRVLRAIEAGKIEVGEGGVTQEYYNEKIAERDAVLAAMEQLAIETGVL